MNWSIRPVTAEIKRLSGEILAAYDQLTLGNLALKAAAMGTTLLNW